MTWGFSFKNYRALFEVEQQRHADERQRADHWQARALEESARANRAEAEVTRLREWPTLFCSFCDKSQHQVKRLIAGQARVFICDECACLAADIVKEATR